MSQSEVDKDRVEYGVKGFAITDDGTLCGVMMGPDFTYWSDGI